MSILISKESGILISDLTLRAFFQIHGSLVTTLLSFLDHFEPFNLVLSTFERLQFEIMMIFGSKQHQISNIPTRDFCCFQIQALTLYEPDTSRAIINCLSFSYNLFIFVSGQSPTVIPAELSCIVPIECYIPSSRLLSQRLLSGSFDALLMQLLTMQMFCESSNLSLMSCIELQFKRARKVQVKFLHLNLQLHHIVYTIIYPHKLVNLR